jgi:CheY-like chemotaxis protein
MSNRPITVLLVGEAVGSSLELYLWLYKRGCRCYFATSFQEACNLVSSTEFDLVLCQYQLPDRTAFSLSDRLAGSRATLFLSKEVESGFLWLPMLEDGRRCIGAPVLRSVEFGEALEKALGAATVSAPLPRTA